jgi:pimeloyl-ACP methyl ester carboxylesterase
MSAPRTITPVRLHAVGVDVLRRSGSQGGNPVVLLHGIGSNASSFAPLMEALDPALDVYAWDAPGYGASKPLAVESPHPSDYADALADALDALELDRVILVGHSLGSLFAGSFAATHPARVAALGLLSPALGYRVATNGDLPPNVQSRIDDLKRLGAETFAASRAARLIYNPETKPEVLTRVRSAMAALHQAGYAQAVRALGHGDLLADAARIKAPTLVAIGAEDAVTPPSGARALHAALPQPLGYREFADTGHALPQEAPVAVARLLEGLVKEARHD